VIERLRIRGFQSLEDVDLSLGRFTVLVGPSNSGKSAIRRALEAVTTNAAPAGRLRTGADQITVEVDAGPWCSVVWEKGPKRNAYTVTTETGTVVQDKPGSTATPEVAAVLGLDADNFSDQFDRPFLLGETPSAVAKALGELTNITVLFDAQREASRQRTEHGRRATTLAEQLDRATTELASYDDLPEEDRQLRAIAAQLATTKAAQDDWVRLAHALRAARQARDALATTSDSLAALPDPTEALRLLAQAEQARAGAAKLRLRADAAAHYASQATEELPEAPELPPDLSIAVAYSQTLQTALRSAQALAIDTEGHALQIELAGRDKAEALSQLTTFDTCPLCGAPADLGAAS